jgi:nicotinate (nicotinamide) nucleotide adenylyltransferase
MAKKNKRIIVMGGSFNPPTLAHYRLMKEAIDALDADIGFFVPVSDAYLKRKMRHSHPPVVLPPELRVKMLQTMCTDKRMAVCEKEIGTIEPRTMPTLMALQEEYPDAELYFLMGADKLKLLIQMTEKRDFLTLFKVVLYSRENGMIEQTLKGDAVLAPYLERIVTLPQPKGTEAISSSVIRERMLSGVSCQDMLCPGVWELFKRFSPADFPDMIDKFKGEYDFMSNRFHWRFEWQGLVYGSAEAAFQASKCKEEFERLVFTHCSPDKAALKGKDIVPSHDWEEARFEIMESIIRAKFEQNPILMRRLKETGNRLLINGNNKQETYWGVDLYSWQGENHLGKIIMNIRDKEALR